MAIFFTTTLVISMAGMLSLLALKRWETTSGRVLGASLRPAVGAFAHRVLTWFEYVAPALVRQGINGGYRYLRAQLHRLVAFAVLVVEHLLERLLKLLRQRTQLHPSEKNASEFLREVSAHKKEIVKSARSRAIYEE